MQTDITCEDIGDISQLWQNIRKIKQDLGSKLMPRALD